MSEIKNRLLFILSLLYQEADEEHPITITQILERLQAEGINGNRRTVAHDLEILCESGFDVIHNKSRQNQYFIGNRHFELAELKLLVDAIQASRFISSKKSQQLIEKLSAFSSVHQATELNRHLYADKQAKSENEQVLYTVDLLHTAINNKKQVEFKYYEYTPEKKKIFKHDSQVYVFSPYGLIWNNDCYYAIGYSNSHNKIIKFRVERVAKCELTQTDVRPVPSDFSLDKYAKTVFRMYEEETRLVTLVCKNTLMKSIVDRFGIKTKTAVVDKNHFSAQVEVSVSATFFGWVVGFGGEMDITSPNDVRAKYHALLERIINNE